MSIFSKSPYGKESRTLLTTKRVVIRCIAVSLSMFLLANTPVKAGPVVIRDVLQRIGSYQNPPDLLLRTAAQTPSRSGSTTPTIDTAKDSLVIVTNSESLLSGVALETNQQDPVKVVHGEVDGTVCDCGEITVAAGGWPKWPLIFLAAIPLFFIDSDDCDDCDKVVPNPTPPLTPTPTPTPPPTTPVPEPASLLLFGSGLAALGASYRRRRLKAKLQKSDDSGGQA